MELNWWIPLGENLSRLMTFLITFKKYEYSNPLVKISNPCKLQSCSSYFFPCLSPLPQVRAYYRQEA